MTTFYWHDYETFGLNRRLDRPAQFAGQRTDEQFNPIGEADVWYCKPTLDYLPQPQACLVTGITPQQAWTKGMCEAKFAENVFEVMNRPGTVSIGYNSLRFDDEVSRHLFWRNFYDPYQREWSQGCSRWDLFPFVLAVWALRPEGICWPTVVSEKDGRSERVSFRLEHLSQANHLEHSHAHDAASDVQATIALARLLSQKQPRLWDWALKNRTKEAVIAALGSGRPCVWIDPYAGQEKGFIRVVLPLSVNPQNKNEYLVWDLRHDPSELVGLSPETIARRAFGSKDAMLEGEERLPLHAIKVNAAPFVCNTLGILNASVCERFGLDLERYVKHGDILTRLHAQLEGPVLLAKEAVGDSSQGESDADAALYDGFVGYADKGAMQRLHALSPETLAEHVREGRLYFDDPRLTELLKRYRARNWPETLDGEEQAQWLEHCRHRLHCGIEGMRTIDAFFNDIDEMAQKDEELLEAGTLTQDAFERRQEILSALYDWAEFVAQATE